MRAAAFARCEARKLSEAVWMNTEYSQGRAALANRVLVCAGNVCITRWEGRGLARENGAAEPGRRANGEFFKHRSTV